MAGSLPNIAAFEPGSNPSESWRYWRQDFEDYIEALKYAGESEKTKTALFRHVGGNELKKQFRAFDLKPEGGASEITLKQILEEFDKYFQDIQNGWPERKTIRNFAKPYWHCKEELYCTDEGIICRGKRLVVAKVARAEILQKLLY